MQQNAIQNEPNSARSEVLRYLRFINNKNGSKCQFHLCFVVMNLGYDVIFFSDSKIRGRLANSLASCLTVYVQFINNIK